MESPSWRRFFSELKRRNVYKVAAAYLGVAFVGFQAAKLMIPSTVLPAWTDEFFLFLLITGFPVALVVAWAFELTPEGVRRTSPGTGDRRDRGTRETAGRRSRVAASALVALGLVAAAVAGSWYLTGTAGDGEVTDRSIAVLPFEGISEESGQGYFATGMTEVLISQLALLEDLTVVSRTSVMRYADSELSLPEIARELDVRYLVEGSVQRSGGEVLIVAQLIESPSDRHLWADRYRRSAEDVFQVQADVAERIARSLEASLSPSEQERLRRQPTDSRTAYDLYLRARELIGPETSAAIELLRQATALDSAFAGAYAQLASAYALRAERGGYGPALADSGLALADTALELDPEHPEAHFHRARCLLILGRLTEARRSFRRAIALRPSYGLAVNALGIVEREQGRLVAALQRHYRARELSPNYPIVVDHLRITLQLLEQDELAEAWAEERRRLGGGYPHSSVTDLLRRGDTAAAAARTERMIREGHWERPVAVLARLALYRGDWERARSLLEEELRERGEEPPALLIRLGHVVGRLGEEARADSLVRRGLARSRRGIERGSERSSLRMNLAMAHAVRERPDSALYWLERAVDLGERDHRRLSSSPLLEGLRGDTRFRALIERIREDVRRMAREAEARGLLRRPGETEAA